MVKVIVAQPQMRNILARIAHEIIEKNLTQTTHKACLTIVGIPTRGVHLAQRLSELVLQFSHTDVEIAVGQLDVTMYRDDLAQTSWRTLRDTSITPEDIDNRIVILVDDVLFTGRTIRAALDALRDLGRPEKVQLAVLVDRGHRELPIKADYVGKNIPTSRQEKISVLVAECDGCDNVTVTGTESTGTGEHV